MEKTSWQSETKPDGQNRKDVMDISIRDGETVALNKNRWYVRR